MNGNVGWTDNPLAHVKTPVQGFARFCSLLLLQMQNLNILIVPLRVVRGFAGNIVVMTISCLQSLLKLE